MNKNIFAIVVIYNGMQKQWIEKCFNSLLQSSIEISIIAVDNVSTDGSVDFIKKKFQSVTIIENKTNFGFGKANNIGIQEAIGKGADFFFLLNQDAWVQKNTVEVLMKNSMENPEYGILSPLHMNGKADLIDEGFYNCINPLKSRKLYSILYTRNITEQTLLELDFIPAACWLLPKKTILDIGGFNPTFYHYAEDDNYVYRLHYHGMKVGIVPFVEVYHDREDRQANDIFDDKIVKYERKIILDISNPLLNGNRKFVEYRLLMSDFFKALLFLDLESVKLVYNKFIKLVKIKSSKVLENKIISQKKGQSFLDFHNKL